MPAKIYYDADADLGLLKGRKIAIIGYGSQGHAHALNLKDSGQDVVVGLYKGSKSWAKAEKDGLRVATVNEAAQMAAVIMILLPDQSQRQVFESEIKGGLGKGKMLMFAHGFNIHFNQLVPPPDVDVTMIAPTAPGHAIGDLFSEGPIATRPCSGAETAESATSPRAGPTESAETKAEMKKICAKTPSNQFAREWVLETQATRAGFLAMRRRDAEHPIEEVGKRLRAMMSWIKPPRMG